MNQREREREPRVVQMSSPPEVDASTADESAHRGEEDVVQTLRRIERTLTEARGLLESQVREKEHREFSVARLLGALLQVLVVGFFISALADWVYQKPAADLLVKLAFAAVVQLGALSAFLLARER